LLIAIFAVLVGLAFGSFANVCISRLPRHESIIAPRSRCPHCLTPIRELDNVPILSWLLLRGRCRSCDARIAVRYPLIEAAMAALFLLCEMEFGLSVPGVAAAVLCWLLLTLAATDAETMLLPDTLTLPGGAVGILYSGFSAGGRIFSWKSAAGSLLAALCAAGVLIFVRKFYWFLRRREGIGLGDAKLLAMIAAWLGLAQTGLTLFLGVVSASIFGIVLIVVRRVRKEGGSSLAVRIPLGAFLSAAGILAIFQGELILSWYVKFFR
jgi:leader peptidase (prepilin peptidase) / N-methyltransferase